MHDCPECGMACDCDGEDTWHDAPRGCDHECDCDYDEDYDDLDACVDCGSPSISDMCQCCGGWLCYMHNETGAGFCKACPTQAWIDEQQEVIL